MAGQPDGLTDVLCLHQPVAVPSQLSDEGRYSVLLFFDTASVLFKTPARGGGGGEGSRGRREKENEVPAGPPPHGDAAVSFDQDGEGDTSPGRSRQQACHDLSKAMAILLADDRIDDENSLEGADGGGPYGVGSRSDSRRLAGGRGRREAEGNPDEGGEASDEELGGGQDGSDGPRRATAGQQQRFSPSPSPASPPPLALRGEFDAPFGNRGEELEAELLEARLARECGLVDESRGGSLDLPLSTHQPRPAGGGESPDEEQRAPGRGGEQQQHQVSQPISPAAAQNEAAEYSSGDESSAAPRFDLLLSPHRPSPVTKEGSPAEDERRAREATSGSAHRGKSGGGDGGGYTSPENVSTHDRTPLAVGLQNSFELRSGREGAENDAATTGESKAEPSRSERKRSSGAAGDGGDAAAAAKDGVTAPLPATRNLRLSLDGYEDDFCDEDESSSGARPEEEGRAGAAGGSFDLVSDNLDSSTVNRGGIVFGGGGGGVASGWEDDPTKGGYASPSSDGVYSGTAAGGLEESLNGDGIDGIGDGRGDISSWEGSPEGLIGGGDGWDIRSPPRSSAHHPPSRSGDRRMLGADW